MDSARKRNESNEHSVWSEPEKKRENRLKSIIDQLRSNKSRGLEAEGIAVESNNDEGLEARSTPPNPSRQLESASFESNSPENQSEGETGATDSETKQSDTPSSTSSHGSTGGRHRKKKVSRHQQNGVSNNRTTMPVDNSLSHVVKAERLSPELGGADARSLSNGSPASPSSVVGGRHPRPPSYPGTPPSAAFTPPGAAGTGDRFSPATLSGGPGLHPQQPLKQMEQMMTRNYSDFMRSLAAKYNNSNPNEYFNSRNGFFDSRFGFKSSATPSLLGLNSMLCSPLGGVKDDAGRKTDPSPLLASAAAFGGFPNIDMSSTQALLNMVRSASAQNAATPPHLDTYLNKGTNKRPFETTNAGGPGGLPCSPLPTAATPSPNPGHPTTSPLDLSASVTKKPRLDPKSVSNALGLGGALTLPGLRPSTGDVERTSPKHRNSGSSRGPSPPSSSSHQALCLSVCTDRPCLDASGQDVTSWNVDDVCQFVASIDLCAEYVEVFREQSIDGSALALLTEEHLTNRMNMKLGPALKFRSVLARRIGHCAVCMHCVHCHGASPATSKSPDPVYDKRPSSVGN